MLLAYKAKQDGKIMAPCQPEAREVMLPDIKHSGQQGHWTEAKRFSRLSQGLRRGRGHPAAYRHKPSHLED